MRSVTKVFKLPQTNPFKRRKTIRALDSVDISIKKQEITCLVGPNGAGKTTLIKILASLITPDSGEILYQGEAAEKSSKRRNNKIGLVTPNERSFYWRLSGRENLLFFGRLHGFRGKELRARVEEVLEETGMRGAADNPYRVYSAGGRQKMNIARALLGTPELYLLDEPAVHLDPVAKEEFRIFVADTLVKKKGAAVLLCTHELAEVRALAQNIIILDAGKVAAQGTPEELADQVSLRRNLNLSFAGDIPAAWAETLSADLTEEAPGRLRVSFDPRETSQEHLVASFVSAGGRLIEAYRQDDDLLEMIQRKTGKHE